MSFTRTSHIVLHRPWKSRGAKKSDEVENGGETEQQQKKGGRPADESLRSSYRAESSKRKSGFRASDELSTDEEEEEGRGVQVLRQQERSAAPGLPGSSGTSSLRKRASHWLPKSSPRAQEGKAKSRELERLRLRPGSDSRLASDTDDTMWEELLQGPDSASSGTSDSEGEGRHNVGVVFPPTSSAALSSDDENNMQQGVAG
ncbi:hypothetical protein CRUP_004296, partial [Coryphaenoides rupestris]